MGYPAQFSFLSSQMSAIQNANLTTGNHVEFRRTGGRGTDIVVATGAGQLAGIFTFAANHTYKVGYGISPRFSGATGNLVTTFTDGAGTAVPTINGGFLSTNCVTATSAADDGFMDSVFGVVVVGGAGLVAEVRLTQSVAVSTIEERSWFYAEVIDFPGN